MDIAPKTPVAGGAGRERILGSDQQNYGGAARSHNSGKYLNKVLAFGLAPSPSAPAILVNI